MCRVCGGKEAGRSPLGIMAETVAELPVTAAAGGNAKGVVDHEGVVAVYNAVGTVECVAEDPDVAPVRERDGVGSVRTLPAEGFAGLGRKARVARRRRPVRMRCKEERSEHTEKQAHGWALRKHHEASLSGRRRASWHTPCRPTGHEDEWYTARLQRER